MNSYETRFISSNIRGAFNEGGIFIIINEKPSRTRLDESNVKLNPSFKIQVCRKIFFNLS